MIKNGEHVLQKHSVTPASLYLCKIKNTLHIHRLYKTDSRTCSFNSIFFFFFFCQDWVDCGLEKVLHSLKKKKKNHPQTNKQTKNHAKS